MRAVPIRLGVLGVILTLSLTGCDFFPSPRAEPSDHFTAEFEPLQLESADATTDFGQSARWQDGLEIIVHAPEEFQSDEPIPAGVQGVAVAVRVEIRNHTGSNFAPAQLHLTAASGTQEAARFIYSTNQRFRMPMTTLPDGHMVQYEIALIMIDPNNAVVDVNPGMLRYTTATFAH